MSRKTLDEWERMQAAANALDVRDDKESTEDEMREWIEAQKAADDYLVALRDEEATDLLRNPAD